jgi:hypothetical protein
MSMTIRQLMLRLAVPVPGLKTGIMLQRAVVATSESHHLPDDCELLVEGESDYTPRRGPSSDGACSIG